MTTQTSLDSLRVQYVLRTHGLKRKTTEEQERITEAQTQNRLVVEKSEEYVHKSYKAHKRLLALRVDS